MICVEDSEGREAGEGPRDEGISDSALLSINILDPALMEIYLPLPSSLTSLIVLSSITLSLALNPWASGAIDLLYSSPCNQCLFGFLITPVQDKACWFHPMVSSLSNTLPQHLDL
jgi:hypothetical protein